ncbi:hypothetical protein ECG_07069 [Echinococcus granulosus]|uniref:MATH domain-containing protein n=1 Tax=Echinococcus granulosus TaxID=6210 RepID=A0A068WWW3_ECHGR|nr:hypothetical protein ECG_07069 [Echinococcus granulosus]CDS22969.1 hypothetical protein EgrG_000697800 [Echinococcus granulosus]
MLNPSSPNSSEAPLLRCSYSPEDESFVSIFLIPSSVVRGFVKEVDSVSFTFLGYKWRLRTLRTKMHIGAFLELLPTKSSTNFELRLDFAFVILNREHFSKNQHFSQRQVLFTRDGRKRGCKTLIELSYLCGDKFLSDDNTFLFEVEFSSPRIDILVQLNSTSELIRFLGNNYVDRYNAENAEHGPILFESGPFNASSEPWHLGVAISHASIFGPDKEKKKVSLYIFQHKGRKSPSAVSDRRFSIMEFACEIESQTSGRRLRLLLDPGCGMSLMVELPQNEANAVSNSVREQIASHIAKKVSFKFFKPILRVKLKSVRLRQLTPRELVLQSPTFPLYCSTIPFDPVNTNWTAYAYPSGDELNLGLRVGVDKNRRLLASNCVDLLWWSAHAGKGNIENMDALEEGQKVALSVATRFHQLDGVELSPPCADSSASDEEMPVEALSPSQCFIKFPQKEQNDCLTNKLERQVDVLLEWHAEYRLKGDHFDIVDVLTHIHMHQMRKELTLLRLENASLKQQIEDQVTTTTTATKDG